MFAWGLAIGRAVPRPQSEAPTVFERIVIELLVKMGYGGSRADAAQAIGIDGLIKEDRLGLDIIYVQAKRWAATVGRPEIQKFAGRIIRATRD
jgi:restriction system protein